ncbi:MAG: rhomboid family intramembrane serine protease [Verrucomicrobia bacterium]|nr:rhomboid family intramembrane serine protease [Verrucomicrobiota bacterium]
MDTQAAAKVPWESEFLPRKPDQGEYGYVNGRKLISCSQEELIERCKSMGYNSTEVSLAWTPEVDRVVPVESIPFLFGAIKEKRRRSALMQLVESAMWGGLLALESWDRVGGLSNPRHLTLFLGLLTVLPAVTGIRALQAANRLTPQALTHEAAEASKGFRLWSSLQTSPWTVALGSVFAGVTLVGIVVAAGLGGSVENAALVPQALFAGEWWRLLTAVFAHAGLMHLMFNAMVLAFVGHQVEVLFGRLFLPVLFLSCALAGSVFSLFLSHAPSVGASGGILGLAGFLAMAVRHRKDVTLSAADRDAIQHLVATVACFAALAGIVAFDLVDSAAHLGGFLAGLGLGAMVRDPKRIGASRTFGIISYASIVVLLAGAVLAIVLMFRPAPKQEAGSRDLIELLRQA